MVISQLYKDTYFEKYFPFINGIHQIHGISKYNWLGETKMQNMRVTIYRIR